MRAWGAGLIQCPSPPSFSPPSLGLCVNTLPAGERDFWGALRLAHPVHLGGEKKGLSGLARGGAGQTSSLQLGTGTLSHLGLQAKLVPFGGSRPGDMHAGY